MISLFETEQVSGRNRTSEAKPEKGRPWYKTFKDRNGSKEFFNKPKNHHAKHLLDHIADRISFGGNKRLGLKPGEALVTNSSGHGLTRSSYNIALKKLKVNGYISAKTCNRGSIVTLTNTDICEVGYIGKRAMNIQKPAKTCNENTRMQPQLNLSYAVTCKATPQKHFSKNVQPDAPSISVPSPYSTPVTIEDHSSEDRGKSEGGKEQFALAGEPETPPSAPRCDEAEKADKKRKRRSDSKFISEHEAWVLFKAAGIYKPLEDRFQSIYARVTDWVKRHNKTNPRDQRIVNWLHLKKFLDGDLLDYNSDQEEDKAKLSKERKAWELAHPEIFQAEFDIKEALLNTHLGHAPMNMQVLSNYLSFVEMREAKGLPYNLNINAYCTRVWALHVDEGLFPDKFVRALQPKPDMAVVNNPELQEYGPDLI